MKLIPYVKYYPICLLLLCACKKNNSSITPVKTDTTATTVITPQTDPVVAKSAGFFLDDWAPKTFTAPLNANVAQPTTAATVTVNVDYSTVITKVPKYLFGNNTNPYMTQIVTEPVLINNIKNL